MKTTLVIAFVAAIVIAACGGGKKGSTTPTNKADPADKGSGATDGSAGNGSAMKASPTGDPCGG